MDLSFIDKSMDAIFHDSYYKYPFLIIVACLLFMLVRWVYLKNESTTIKPDQTEIFAGSGKADTTQTAKKEPETVDIAEEQKKPEKKMKKEEQKKPATEDHRKGNFSENQQGGTVNQFYMEGAIQRILTPKLSNGIDSLIMRNKGKGIILSYSPTGGTEVYNFKNEILQYLLNKGVVVEEVSQVRISPSAPTVGVELNDSPTSVPKELPNYHKFCEILIGENVPQK